MKKHLRPKIIPIAILNQLYLAVFFNKISTLTLIIGLLSILSSCSTQQPTVHKATIMVFGTLVDISIFYSRVPSLEQAQFTLSPPSHAQQAEEAIQTVEQQFHQFHQQWHAWEQGGIISKINQAIARQHPITVPNSVKDFIVISQKLTQQSQGLFDPGIGQLVALWGFHSETWQGPPPSTEAIEHWLNSRPSLMDIYFQGNALHSHNPNVQLDFGGNAKGLAIDMALESLQNSGIQNALVSIGGDMKAIGSKNGQPWRVGIQNPQHPNQVLASLSLKSGESVVTSGTYQRMFKWQGKSFSHILNPKTGYPAHRFASVTVLHPNAITADAAATALLIAGVEQWESIAKSMGVQYVFAVDEHGKIFQTDAMAQRISLL
ncbi:FAD:protein FMN transferase [hydrothermal vent metagenome]|uniref:FAD:protein FMN transferase n=1 Tax=hydrothermal vent metagenome TaxID=652676 RepID=A0A3B0WAW9_9ZZZZ